MCVTVFHWDLGLDRLLSQPRDPPVPCWDCSCAPPDPDFIYFNHIAFIKACVCVYKGYMWRSKDNPWQPALAFHPMCSGDGSRDIRLDCQRLYQAISPAPSYFWQGNLTQILMLAKQALYQRSFLPLPVVNSRTVTTEGSQGQSQLPIPSQLQTWAVRFLGLLENEQWLPPLRKFSHVSQECWEHSSETQTNARVEN